MREHPRSVHERSSSLHHKRIVYRPFDASQGELRDLAEALGVVRRPNRPGPVRLGGIKVV